MVKVLLTGSSGFIGRNLKERLEKDGYEVICYDRKYSSVYSFRSKDIDYVINCAGEIKDYNKMIGTNLELLVRLLELSKIFGIKKFIQIGSSSELGNVNYLRSEHDPCQPSNLYQGTKSAATMLCQGYAGEFNMDIVVARPFTIYGKYEQEDRFIPSLWNSFVNDRQFNLYPGSHDFVYVDDFIDGIILLLNSKKQTTGGQIYHFGTGISTSNEVVVGLFEKHIGKNLNVIRHKEKYHEYDCDNWQASTEKSYLMLGWKHKVILDQGIKKYIDWRWFEGNAVADIGAL